MRRSRMLRVVLITAAAGLAVPAALTAQQAPRAPRVDVARLPALQQVGTVDVRGETLPLYRGRSALRARVGSRGAVLRLASHDLRLVVPAGASASSTLGLSAEHGWPSKVRPLRRVGPSLTMVGELSDASSPLLFDMRIPDLDAQPGHRLVLVGVAAPDPDARAVKIELSRREAVEGREARAGARATGIRATGARATGARALRARARARAPGARALRARATSPRVGRRVMPVRPYEVWTGTLDGKRVHIVSAFYDPRTDRMTAEFDGAGSFQSFAFGWLAEDVLESSTLRKRPGRTTASEGRMIRAVPRE